MKIQPVTCDHSLPAAPDQAHRYTLRTNMPFYITSFLKAFAELTFFTGLPFFAIRLGAGPFELGILGATGMGVYTVSCLTLSRWVDRLDPKRLVLTSLGLAVTLALAVSQAESVGFIILAAGLNGFLSAWYWPFVMTWLGRRAAQSELTRHLGWFNLSWSSGVPLGTLATGLLFEIRPQLPFYVAALMLAFGLLTIARVQHHPSSLRADRPSRVHVNSPSRKRHVEKRYFLYLSWISMVCTFFTIGNLRYQLPKRAIDAGMGEAGIASFLFLMSLAQLVIFFSFSRWDGWPFRFRYILFGHLSIALAMLFVFRSVAPQSLFVAMLLAGTGNGIIYFSSLYYGQVFRTVRGRNMAIHESTIGIGFLAGSFGGGLAAERWGLAAPYVICFGLAGMMCLAWAVAAIRARFNSSPTCFTPGPTEP